MCLHQRTSSISYHFQKTQIVKSILTLKTKHWTQNVNKIDDFWSATSKLQDGYFESKKEIFSKSSKSKYSAMEKPTSISILVLKSTHRALFNIDCLGKVLMIYELI